jgi:hypothetical protein
MRHFASSSSFGAGDEDPSDQRHPGGSSLTKNTALLFMQVSDIPI